jgi:hypothetical protein
MSEHRFCYRYCNFGLYIYMYTLYIIIYIYMYYRTQHEIFKAPKRYRNTRLNLILHAQMGAADVGIPGIDSSYGYHHMMKILFDKVPHRWTYDHKNLIYMVSIGQSPEHFWWTSKSFGHSSAHSRCFFHGAFKKKHRFRPMPHGHISLNGRHNKLYHLVI